MTLELIKTTKILGRIKIDDTVVKTMTADIDDKGVTTPSDWVDNAEIYAANRHEVRKQEQAFQEAVYAAEDAIIAELETGAKEKKG